MKNVMLVVLSAAVVVLLWIVLSAPMVEYKREMSHGLRLSGESVGHTAVEIALSIGVLVFGLIIAIFQIKVILANKSKWSLENMKAIGLTLIITSILFLIVSGYSQEQIAPAFGLLGTVAGYLLANKEETSVTATGRPDTQWSIVGDLPNEETGEETGEETKEKFDG